MNKKTNFFVQPNEDYWETKEIQQDVEDLIIISNAEKIVGERLKLINNDIKNKVKSNDSKLTEETTKNIVEFFYAYCGVQSYAVNNILLPAKLVKKYIRENEPNNVAAIEKIDRDEKRALEWVMSTYKKVILFIIKKEGEKQNGRK